MRQRDIFIFLPHVSKMMLKRKMANCRQVDMRGRKAGAEKSKVRDLVEDALLASQRPVSFVFCIK